MTSALSHPTAFIQVGNQQVKTQVGDAILIDYNSLEVGSPITFDQVLLITDEKKTHIGKPYLKGAHVIGEVEAHRKDDKVTVFKKKRRKGYKVKQGHRQTYTQVMIKEIINQ